MTGIRIASVAIVLPRIPSAAASARAGAASTRAGPPSVTVTRIGNSQVTGSPAARAEDVDAAARGGSAAAAVEEDLALLAPASIPAARLHASSHSLVGGSSPANRTPAVNYPRVPCQLERGDTVVGIRYCPAKCRATTWPERGSTMAEPEQPPSVEASCVAALTTWSKLRIRLRGECALGGSA